jgi:hypothetical protein
MLAKIAKYLRRGDKNPTVEGFRSQVPFKKATTGCTNSSFFGACASLRSTDE